MGSPAGSGGGAVADCTVGSIVWVRRRNGSWWPGKILGPEELDSTHLTSPRSGTPVKLLGREDASVDWYNLEKSKRVKPFRCGDFDDCIERVESSQGLTIRKREKYARREDAIIHALELEKELLRKQGKLVPEGVRSRSSRSAQEDLVTSVPLGVSNGKAECSGYLKSIHVGNALYSQNLKEEDQPSGEDEHIDVAPRMRGLQDFGLRTAPSKRKASSFGAPDASLKPMADHNSPASSSGDVSTERSSHSYGKELIGGTPWTKRSRYLYTPAESSAALDFQGTPLSQVEMLPSSFGDADSHPHRHSVIEESTSEFMEDVECDSSDSSDSSETEEDTDEDIAMFSGIARRSEPGQDAFGRHRMGEDESTSSEEHDESSLSGETSYLYQHDPVFANETVSKWQLKGRRNIRSLARRSVDKADARRYNRSEHGTYHELKKAAFGRKSLGHGLDFHGINDLSDGTDEADSGEEAFGDQIVGPGNGGYFHSARAASRSQNNLRYILLDWGDDPWEGRIGFKRHWEDKNGRLDPLVGGSWHFTGKSASMLIDVDLEVQASYKKEPVPIVSLMSRLDGRAIIGHPIQIEVLEDGSSESFLNTGDYFRSETIYHDKAFALPPAWRTARRSNSRVPRTHPSSALEVDEATDDHSFIDQGRKPPFKKLNIGNVSKDSSLFKKSSPRIPRPPMDKRLQKKLPKKSNASANQKTRALSSIGMEHFHGMRPLRDSSNCQMDGFITTKPEALGPPTVACIPMKLVFSRLLEKINRPPLKAAAKMVLSNSDAGRDPT